MELFSQSGDAAVEKASAANNPLFASLRRHERPLSIVMGIIIISIISFSLGVEKGKRMAVVKDSLRFDTASSVTPQAAPQQISTADQKPQEAIQQGYTIQLASFKTKANAKKEAEALTRKGLSPIFLSKGSYTILCVGNFSNKNQAQPVLSELKRRYQDCYLRRL